VVRPTGVVLFGCVNNLRVGNKLNDLRIVSCISGRRKGLIGVPKRETDQQTAIFADLEGFYLLESNVLREAQSLRGITL
jgi:hypothetical protein